MGNGQGLQNIFGIYCQRGAWFWKVVLTDAGLSQLRCKVITWLCIQAGN
jgi:hypothetical protein